MQCVVALPIEGIRGEQCRAHEAADRAVCQWRAFLRRLGDGYRYANDSGRWLGSTRHI
ncbi:hypothetical protein [Stieleria varia]|uniref:hypothetical protein n=1 Tax=Stieleria varia TaxID=2528005 RepID=UPI001E2DF574|nr:hypothetical protein [Stieleria varia]